MIKAASLPHSPQLLQDVDNFFHADFVVIVDVIGVACSGIDADGYCDDDPKYGECADPTG